MNSKLNELYEIRDSLAISMTYHHYLLQCYEAKIKRVEPLSVEFEKTVNSILDIQYKLKDFGRQQIENRFAIERETEKLKYKQTKKEVEKMMKKLLALE